MHTYMYVLSNEPKRVDMDFIIRFISRSIITYIPVRANRPVASPNTSNIMHNVIPIIV